LRWTASQRFKVPEDEPIPLALGSQACMWRRVADEALEGQRHTVRNLFASKNYTAVLTVVRAGLAVTVLPVGMIGDGLRALGPAEGLPRLPISRMGLIHAPGPATQETRALAEAVRATIGEERRAA
jgi:DNA-binding transcriptional LysR family regulator